ncbi:PAS domain-containing protein [Mucilaginibacter rubeus]|uniref:histidine kinase n=1 Tax=Mucilaginibacter rubeus TaxID=2027860 RepID=A0A5C1I6F5_9SPHI|nr:PAS domain-containing protein [Mucilaginibacter rubeus]QEM12940.1 PAS domain-containing protein [Mucilaginibacter rubeus]
MKPGTRFLHSLFEVAHVEFQTYDLSNQKVLFSSGVTRQLLGYSESEYVNLSNEFYRSIIHPDDYEKVQQTINKTIQSKSGDVIEMTVRLRRIDGSYIWLYSRQMIYQRNHANGTLTIIREVEDVTRLVELQGDLEEKVEQLKAISYKNSHLLRGPVSSIIGLVDLIEEHAVTSDHNRQILHYLKETIAKLDGVVREINENANLR